MSLKDLHDAIEQGETTAAANLIHAGTSVNEQVNGETAFTLAMQSEKSNQTIINSIINCPQFDSQRRNRFGRTPLFIASQKGPVGVVKTLLSFGTDANTCDYRGITALEATTWENRADIANVLIQHGACVNTSLSNRQTPLHRACSEVSKDVVKVLLHNGGDVDSAHFEKTPLMEAVPSSYMMTVQNKKKSDMLEIMKMLISAGCDMNAKEGKSGMTALHMAVERNDVHTTCLLADAGARLDIENKDGMDPFDIAVDGMHLEIAIYLILYGYVPLFQKYERYLKFGKASFNQEQKRFLTTLILEHMHLNDTQSRRLLEELKAPSHETPQSLQARCRRCIRKHLGAVTPSNIKRLDMAENLQKYLTFDFDFERRNPLALLDLCLAIDEQCLERVKSFPLSDIDLNFSVDGQTPLTVAASRQNLDIVELLLENGADATTFDSDGYTALHKAAACGAINTVKIFLDKGLDVNSRNKNMKTALCLAAFRGHFDIVIYLLTKDCDPNTCDDLGIYPIHYAAGSGHLDAVSALIQNGSSVNVTDHMANNPLHVAASRGQIYTRHNINLPSLYKDEVFIGLDAFRLMNDQISSNYFRVGTAHFEVVRLLLASGSDTSARNSMNKTPKGVALDYRFLKVVDEIAAFKLKEDKS